jgi:hypothetical protein
MIAQSCDNDRSLQCWRLVRALNACGLDPEEIHKLMPRHTPSVSKYGERLAGEVDRILAKLQ